MFQRVAGFLSVGTRNREFYLQNRVPQDRLFFVPYVVDNSFFRGHCSAAAPQRERLRHSIGLQPGRPVILFAGRIAPAKAPDELLAAFSQVHARLQGHSAPYLLFVGDGPMRRLIESVPCYGLTLGDDVNDIPKRIGELLDRINEGAAP